MRKILAIIVILLLSFKFSARADEGMWLLPLIEQLNIGKMTKLGLKLSAEDIYNLNKASIKDAVVSFGGICTGEIVSSQGLLLTNHHCGYGYIQSHSSVDHDYLRNGFWAKSMEEELPNDDLFVNFLIRIEDVTDKVLDSVKQNMNETERENTIENACRSIEKEAKEGNKFEAEVSSFYGNNYFYLFVYEHYPDVRLVGAPPSSIGKFGSDSDNWEWPRHTGDFSVFRVYSGPDGKPASYSEDNIPLKPKYFLPVSIKDLEEDDYTMIMGYPGSTSRYMTSYEIDELMNIIHPNRIKIRGTKQDIWMKDMKADPKVNIQYASKYFTSSNYWKYSIGQEAGLRKLNVKSRKEKIEDKFRQWILEDDKRKDKYGDALKLIESAVKERAELYNARQYLSECFRGCEILQAYNFSSNLRTALEIDDKEVRNEAIEKAKKEAGEFYKDYNPSTDKKTMKAMLMLFRDDIPNTFHPSFYENMIDAKFNGDIDGFVDRIFKKSIFASEAEFNSFLKNPSLKKLENDLVIRIAESRYAKSVELAKKSKVFEEQYYHGRRLWMAALKEMIPDKTLYPDANFTMRLTYGTVKGYIPEDAVTYRYYTTLQGMVDKYIPGDYEFDLPEKLIEFNKKKEFGRYGSPKGYMPVCFLTTNDITGGNSGSPVMNENGELIGLAFDGNWESMSGDIAYEQELQRTIVVDIRYVLWVMDVFAGAKNLIDEMVIVE